MIVPRRILVVHADACARRRLLLVLVEAGYDVRAFGAAEPAMAAAREEWFDLALIDYALPGGQGFGFTRVLRQAQPTVPIIMLLPSLELPLIIEGIRLGLTDVLPAEEDPCAIVRRVHGLLRPSAPSAAPEELTPADLAQVEGLLARLDVSGPRGAEENGAEVIAALREELKAAMRERTALEGRLERVLNEKEALAAELQTLLTQNVDSSRLQAELAQLQTQREMTAAAQVAIEIKARQLAETRAIVEAERAALEEAKKAGAPVSPAVDAQAFEAERIHLAAVKEDLKAEENRLRAEATRLRQESVQLSRERRRWHEELDELREREENLRAYEERLRGMQAELESQRLRMSNTPAVDLPGVISAREAALQTELDALRKQIARAEAETAVSRDERMTLQELEHTIRQREERLRELEEQISAYEGLHRSLLTAEASNGPRTGVLKSFTGWGKSKG
jgi:DNA-binding response OmpR family regulator